jgi:membrane associated rhomboid family serine protease
MFYSDVGMLDSWDQTGVRRPLRRLSGSVRDWLDRFGSVVSVLVWLNVVVFVAQLLAGIATDRPFVDWLFALSGQQLARGFIWQPLTYMFLHADVWHILINMLLLWFFGREVEYFLGPRCFTRLYLMCGLAGAGLWLLFNFHSAVPVIGASAAVLGCVIAFATLFPNREITLLVFFVLPVTMKARYLALIAVALDLVPLLQQTQSGVAHLAHIGGMILGYLYVKELGYGPMPAWLDWVHRAGRGMRPRRRPRAEAMSREEFISKEVDPILDKIAREGMQSLTRRERKILESAKDLMQNRQR